jgi:hypothetical protein
MEIMKEHFAEITTPPCTTCNSAVNIYGPVEKITCEMCAAWKTSLLTVGVMSVPGEKVAELYAVLRQHTELNCTEECPSLKEFEAWREEKSISH